MSELAEAVLAAEKKVGALIEESSLGTAGARQLRRRVSAETADYVVARAEAAPAPDDGFRHRRLETVAANLETVVPAAVAGNNRAVDELIQMLSPLVLRYCNARLGMRATCTAISSEDVSQEVLLAVVAALPGYRHGGRTFLAFVYAIASHKVTDALRVQARERSEPVDSLPDTGDDDNVPERRALARELNAKMSALLCALPLKQREILVLRVVVGLSATETADALGITSGQVRVIQHRALSKLRRLYTVDD